MNFRVWLLPVVLAAGLFAASASFASDTQSVAAFGNFVKSGNYKDANFYIENNLVAPADVDTSQLFYDALTERYLEKLSTSAGAVDQLYQYLNAIGPIDLNKIMACSYQSESVCLLANDLFRAGARRDAVAYFAARGLDLNKRVPEVVPATVPLLLRLGTGYTMDDVNYFSSLGLVLGDEVYTISELADYRDDNIFYDYRLDMPSNFQWVADQNLLDFLIIALGTRTHSDPAEESIRRKTLCGFINYAAASFVPSFDYLEYVLAEIKEFRGNNTRPKEYRNSYYQPFPDSCVAMIVNMAASHLNIVDLVNRYANAGDVQTAKWLQAIGQRRKN